MLYLSGYGNALPPSEKMRKYIAGAEKPALSPCIRSTTIKGNE
jgi:hypothetical protein